MPGLFGHQMIHSCKISEELWRLLNKEKRINEAWKRSVLCSKSTGHVTHAHPPSPVIRRSHREVMQPGNPMYPAVEVCTSDPPSFQQRKAMLQPDLSCWLTPLRFPAFSHQPPGSTPRISQNSHCHSAEPQASSLHTPHWGCPASPMFSAKYQAPQAKDLCGWWPTAYKQWVCLSEASWMMKFQPSEVT